MATRTAYAPVAGEVLTAANLGSMPGGWIGYVEVTAAQTGISAEVDLTGLTVTVTVGTSRRIRVQASLVFNVTTSGNFVRARIKEGATQLQERGVIIGSAASEGLDLDVVLTPTAGAHTYKLTALMPAGTGSIGISAGATIPAFLLVEDVGAA